MEDKSATGTRFNQCQFAFVKWLEDPPKWNVVPVKHVKCKGEMKLGQIVDAKWGASYHRALLLDLGTQNAMEKKVLEAEEKAQLEREVEDDDSSASSDENYGKGCRAKKYRKLDEEAGSTSEARVMSKKAAHKRHEKAHSMAVLREVQNAREHQEQRDCMQCKEKDEIILKLRRQVEVLQDLNITSNNVHGLAKRLEDAVIWLEDNKYQLLKTAETDETRRPQEEAASPVPGPSGLQTPDHHPPTLPMTPVCRPPSEQPRAACRPPTATPTSRPTDYQSPKMVTIGPHVSITSAAYMAINFEDKRKAVRDLLVAAFGRDVVQKSSMRGQPCNGNKYKMPGHVARPALDQGVLNDVIAFLVNRLKMTESEIRDVIRKKINDENNAALRALKRKNGDEHM